jgi:hypothetical protein
VGNLTLQLEHQKAPDAAAGSKTDIRPLLDLGLVKPLERASQRSRPRSALGQKAKN